jgi:DNA-binding XRE family transcriptional regulator
LKAEDKIREHLKAYRAKMGKTQKEMAEYLGVSYVTYQEMEKGIVKSVKVLNILKDKTGYASSTKQNMYDDETIYIKDKDLHEFTGDRVELIAAMRAAIKILTLRNIENEVKLSELESKLSGGKNPTLSFAEVSLKLERMMQDEGERTLDEWRKK